MNPRFRRALLLLLTLLPITFGRAQEAPSQTFAEEIEVRVIDLDVVVTDNHGRPITGLTREDFELLEDGKPVQIRYFTPVAEGNLVEPAASEAVRATAAPPETNRAPVTWVVFIDQTSMSPGPRNRALDHLRGFLETSLASGDRGVVASNDGLALRIKQNVTSERRLLMDALAKLRKERVHQGPGTLRVSQLRHDIRVAVKADQAAESSAGFISGDVMNAEYFAEHLGTQISMVMTEEVQRTRNAIRSLGALVDALADMDGRLALVYVGAGFNTLPALELVDLWREKYPEKMTAPSAPDPEHHRQALQDEVDRLYANLSATRVTVYTIHAASVAGVSVQDAGPEVLNMNRSGIAGDRAQSTEAALARGMAQNTGGLYFTINPGLTKQLAAVRGDLDHYYSLGYVPTGKPGNARQIRVRVKTDGARVRHRAIVRERTRPEEASRAAVASLVQPQTKTAVRRLAAPAAPPAALPAEANPLGVQIEASRPQRDGWGTDHLLPFDLKLGTMMFVPKGPVHRAEFVLHFALVEPNGTIWPVESREHSLEIPNAEVPTSPDQAVSFVWHVDLTPLRVPREIPIKTTGMKLMVTVEDRASHTRSVVTVPVQKPGQPYFPGDEKSSGSL